MCTVSTGFNVQRSVALGQHKNSIPDLIQNAFYADRIAATPKVLWSNNPGCGRLTSLRCNLQLRFNSVARRFISWNWKLLITEPKWTKHFTHRHETNIGRCVSVSRLLRISATPFRNPVTNNMAYCPDFPQPNTHFLFRYPDKVSTEQEFTWNFGISQQWTCRCWVPTP